LLPSAFATKSSDFDGPIRFIKCSVNTQRVLRGDLFGDRKPKPVPPCRGAEQRCLGSIFHRPAVVLLSVHLL
jgi:hypothetical protein